MSDLIPDGWDEIQLGNISSLITKGTTPKKYSTGGVNFVKVESVSASSSLIPSKFAYIDIATHEDLKRSQLKNGDILFSIAGSLGRLAIVSERHLPANTNQALAIIRLKKDHIDIGFCIQQLKGETIQSELKNLQTVGAQPNLSLQQISNIVLKTPPLPEQQKIAATLTSVDEVIEKTQAQIDKLKDLKTGMMQELLTRGVGNDGKPHTEFKDSPVGRIPKGWEVVDLDEVTKVIDCKHATPKYFNEGYPVVKPGNIKEGNLNVSGCAFTDRSGFDNLNENHKPRVGDIIYSRNQTYGIGAYVNKEIQFCIGQDVCIISPINCVSQYIYFTVNAPVVREQVELLAAGSTFKRINLGAIRKLKVPMPPFEEQEKIASVLASIDAKVAIVKIKLAQLINTKKALMQDLLTGKVRVNVSSEASGH